VSTEYVHWQAQEFWNRKPLTLPTGTAHDNAVYDVFRSVFIHDEAHGRMVTGTVREHGSVEAARFSFRQEFVVCVLGKRFELYGVINIGKVEWKLSRLLKVGRQTTCTAPTTDVDRKRADIVTLSEDYAEVKSFFL